MFLWKRLIALLRLRCPHCLQGAVFRTLWQMREECPVCGIHFERETGFFMNAIFIAYIIGFLTIAPFCVWLYWLDAPTYLFFIAPGLLLLLLSPAIFRYSRLLWLHLDEVMDPRGGG